MLGSNSSCPPAPFANGFISKSCSPIGTYLGIKIPLNSVGLFSKHTVQWKIFCKSPLFREHADWEQGKKNLYNTTYAASVKYAKRTLFNIIHIPKWLYGGICKTKNKNQSINQSIFCKVLLIKKSSVYKFRSNSELPVGNFSFPYSSSKGNN